MKRALLWLALISCIVAFVLSGCSPITNGEIVSKDFVPEHEEEDVSYIKVGDVDVPVYDSYTVPDKWYVTFGKEDEDGVYKKRTVQVDQFTYNQVSIGDWFSLQD